MDIQVCNVFETRQGQNWFKNIQLKILLSGYKNNDSEIGQWMNSFHGLSYLPPEEVSDEFCELMSISPSIKSSTTFKFSDYILENYIDLDSNFPPKLWDCEPINNPKTTNGADPTYYYCLLIDNSILN
ncbi:Hypothetical protein CINCED_3A012683 [Cinara cedri]|uniref:Uncharacterized protein n=1 Tax=Cinara cedri TaxID=506608 RepID=A0A5E4MZT4_9HEMI|nr:Hypothetical protein CINCED_3A012683 [Cinara cedri]